MKHLNINFALYALIIGLFLAFSHTTQAATLTVTKTADTNDTVCDGDCSLREAFDVADGNAQTDTINFNIPTTDLGCGGTAICTITLTSAIEPAADGGNLTTITGTGANIITLSGGNATKHFTILANVSISMDFLTISGGNGASPTFTNCGGAICVVTASLTMDNVVLQNNSTPGDGGAINANAGSTLTVTNSIIRNNSAGNVGGGILSANTGSVLNITNSTISGNSATNSGGGVYVFSNTTMVTNTSFSSNTATFGAGFYSERSSTTITDSTISNNTAATEGGGLSNNTNVSGGSVTVNNSVINNNRANTGSGGAVSTFGLGTLTINNSTISNNSSPNSGGGIIVFSGTTNLTNSTVSGNSSTGGNGGGIRNLGTANLASTTFSNNFGNNGSGVSNGNGTMTLNNTIVANSLTGGDCGRTAGTINSIYSLIEGGLTCVNGTNTNNLTGDPNLGLLANNGGATQTHALQTASIAIDTGNSALTTDQRGFARPVDEPTAPNGTGNLSDIGAFEVQGAATGGVSQTYLVNSTNDPGDGTCNAAECTLREAINSANANIGGTDQINFDASLAGQTITLTSGQLPITDVSGTLTINGLGANQLAVSGNNASRVFNVSGGTVSVINGIAITNGNTDFGGGIRITGNLTVNNAAIRNNTASNSGGGIRIDPGAAATVNNSTVSGNTSAATGGGIDTNGSAAITVTNSTISGNTATGSGGGIVNTGTLTMNSSTVSNNSSPLAAGFRNVSGTSNLNNTIIADSISGSDCVRDAGTINATYNLIEGGLTCVNGTNSNNLTGDPNLGALANNGGTTFTHALLAGSIAIDAGNSLLTTDQRGSTRPVDDPNSPNGTGNLADIGAFEVQAPTAAGISIGGRVLVNNGRGLSNALVYLTAQSGETRTARTNPFGYYRFTDVAVGQTLIVNVFHKQYQFNPQVVSINDNIANLDFTPQTNQINR
jgi:CSLREA domain-containing protein